MASDPQVKNRMQVFKNKGKDQDVSIESLHTVHVRNIHKRYNLVTIL